MKKQDKPECFLFQVTGIGKDCDFLFLPDQDLPVDLLKHTIGDRIIFKAEIV